MEKTLVAAVLTHGTSQGKKAALILKKETITYDSLVRQIRSFAWILKEDYHIEAGDRIMLTGLSRPEYLVALMAVQYLHGITIPLDRVWLEDTVLKLYDYIEPALVLTDMNFHRNGIRKASLKQLYKTASESEAPADPDYTLPDESAVAEMLFTTGTTGMPKGVMLTYGNILAIAENNRSAIGFRSEDVMLNALPLCHSLGLRAARMALWSGATLVLQNGLFSPEELEDNIEQEQCTAFVCVPAIMEKLTRSVEDFDQLFAHFRVIEIGAGSLSYDLKRRLPKLLPNTEIYNTWGSSETGGVIFLDVSRRQDKITALGKPIPTAQIKIVDESGEEITSTSIDNAGRLAIKGNMTMAGYYQLPEKNRETLIDGWLYTNDLVYTDDEGFVYMVGRSDDIINVGGEKVSPLEIENVASEFDRILDDACIGVDDPVMGQVPVLFIVQSAVFSEGTLIRFLSRRLEPYKLPRHIIVVEEIPRNRMKKLDRKAVRRLWDEMQQTNDADNIVLTTIFTRHSVRSFTGEAVSRQALETLVKAGIHAPTGKNMQTWHFTVITNKEMISRIRETGKSVAERENTGFYGFNNPSALILITNDIRNDNAPLDSACAAENILLAAHSMGLGACWLNGLTRISDQPEIQDLLKDLSVPEHHKVWSMIALGHPAVQGSSPARNECAVQWIE